MNIRSMINFVVVALALMAATGRAADAPAADIWVTDMEAAKAQAKKENKDLLLDFTGSDWCGWCIKLRKEVFDQADFKTFAGKELVMVELDFPHKKKLDEKLTKQNKDLAEGWGVQGFPTIMLCDADGKPYARTGYQEGGPAKYIEHVKELKKNKATRDDLLTKAAAAQGVEKAKLLDQAFEKLMADGVGGAYQSLADEVVTLDKDNAAGLKGKYENRKKLAEIANTAETGDVEKAMTMTETLLADKTVTGELKQEALFLKANLQYNKKDTVAAVKTLGEARDAAPKSDRATEIGQILEQLKQADKK